MLRDATSATAGFLLGHWYAMDYAYKHRAYVRQRLAAEKKIAFVRKPLPPGQKLLEEYPFLDIVPHSDKELQNQRINPAEADVANKKIHEE